MLKIATDKQCIVQLGYMFRSNPAFQFLFEAVRNGWLGEIFEVHGVISKKLPAADRAELAKYRGGAMFELGCHLIDAVVRLLGKPQRVEAANLQTQPNRDSLRDNCLAILHYAGATATVRSSLWRSMADDAGNWWSAALVEPLRSNRWNRHD